MRRLLDMQTVRMTLVVVVLVGLLAVAEAFSTSPQYVLTGSPSPETEAGLYERFAEEITEFGPAAAYDRMGIALEAVPLDWQHDYAHRFGKVLYEHEGEGGIVFCDWRFSLGCFHQLMSEAIVEHGPDAIPRLYDACTDVTKNRDMCQHGLGHGILSAQGYEESDLAAALKMCERATNEDTVSGCKGGLFMEYNIRTIANAEGIAGSRQADFSRMYAPCDALEAADMRICTFWLPQWWFFSALNSDRTVAAGNEGYLKVGRLCAGSAYPQTCFEGFGYVTPSAFGFDAEKARQACDTIDSGREGILYCRSMAALIFHITPGKREMAPQLCNDLQKDERDVCMQYAFHDGDFAFSVPMEQI